MRCSTVPARREIINNCNVLVFASFIFGINGEERQLSSIINIVTFDAACECENDALRDCFKTNKRQTEVPLSLR